MEKTARRRIFLLPLILLLAARADALIIYRPPNSGGMDSIRCYLTVTDSQGNDVTESAVSASYAWYYAPNEAHPYQGRPYLAGGMAMHIRFVPGEYTLTLTTPQEKQNAYDPSLPRTGTAWLSNEYRYDTDDAQLKVIFVSPVADENGFYTGGWHIDYRAPEYYIRTKPYRTPAD